MMQLKRPVLYAATALLGLTYGCSHTGSAAPSSTNQADTAVQQVNTAVQPAVAPSQISGAHAQLKITNGSQISIGDTGRTGAAAARVSGYSPAMTTINGNQVYSSSQTFNNVNFTGNVLVTGGDVKFNFCSFTFQPPDARHSSQAQQLLQYNNGGPCGAVTCNWCDFDTNLPLTGGNFETCNFQSGQRVSPATTGSSSFTLYRCRLQHCGNAIGMHKHYTDKMSYITECYFGDPTTGSGSHPDGFEIYSSDNITVRRCRINLDSRTDQSCLNITNDFGDVPKSNPIIIEDNYINGGSSPVLALTQGGSYKRNVQFTGNHFGDSSHWGRECDFDRMDVTHVLSYALSHPGVLYWAKSNIWSPDGEGVTNPKAAPSGDPPAGLPHKSGEFVDPRNFYGGAIWIWNGHVVP